MITISPIICIIVILIKLDSKGPSIHWSRRIGKGNKEFLMPKFRTMQVGTPQLATHLLSRSDNYITRIGSILRKTSLDEIPQLYSILKGDMSFVGPRPALYNQKDLIIRRKKHNIDSLPPGITGWAQINGRDLISIDRKVELDHYYLLNKSLKFDMKIIYLTITKVPKGIDISH